MSRRRSPSGAGAGRLRALATPLGAAVAASLPTLGNRVPAGWELVNHRGRRVSLTGGAGVAGGLVLAGVLAGRVDLVVAAGGSALVGRYDDVAGARDGVKGFAGHLGALRSGRLTAGTVKLLGIPAVAVAAALLHGRDRTPLGVCRDAALVAGTANLVNLFDLRPGRALKVVAAAAAVTGRVRDTSGQALLAASLAALPADVRERTMLGDAGANALGASLGLAWCAGRPAARWGALAGVAALTALSERLSFSAWIVDHPWAAAVDGWGRLP
ncbi:MAG: hypothetical protein JWM67_1799 [Mycobacterium sp.]|nr:hypothetical protein [Mycobacterium sp.]